MFVPPWYRSIETRTPQSRVSTAAFPSFKTRTRQWAVPKDMRCNSPNLILEKYPGATANQQNLNR